ncbi:MULTISPECIES: glycosyltransferase family 2 protein [unclassified Bradyrhizobium]|uniref:glycosyltransferase family 2 protein n=1 Tax=unclassified Bradyrhizobium TaxID=2631580 RepID=UPI001FFAD9C0|nr:MULTISPECIES: glycosyltransferase family 2 protein [unclassified Bradyrhizobium]MCK1328783.1 glycosyltransferase family 2 protein [Bradyrhizobium sp. CW9]MCK1693441.1 glycosyltransferase family 2 protein [Bradyrhizobium sp. 144]
MPTVSFVVPCFKLAEFLGDCVHSILSQTYEDFEILIMDDCSPDHTGDVAQSLKEDSRVKYIRNEFNLGHLRNYNKAIGLSRGRYIWLISADDRLRSRQVLSRYLQLMERRPEIGFAFCPAIGIRDGTESGLISWSFHGNRDVVFNGRDFLKKLLKANCVAAPSVLARTECYDKSLFPMDLPNTGDWFLWCLFAMHYDVAYFAEPMVHYRLHENQMTNWFLSEEPLLHAENDIIVRWRTMKSAQEAGLSSLASDCAESLASFAAYHIACSEDGDRKVLNALAVQNLLRKYAADENEREAMECLLVKALGDQYLDRGMRSKAAECYGNALRRGPVSGKLLAKYGLSRMGSMGSYVLDGLRLIRGSRGSPA